MAERKSKGDQAKTDIVAGQYRFLTSASMGVLVIGVDERGAVVERIPGGNRFVVRAIEELRSAPLMSVDGFRMRWLRGDMNLTAGNEQSVLQSILSDEVTRGRDRVRLRVLDEYLSPLLDGDDARERLGACLDASDFWRREGIGSDVGYVPADQRVDWRRKWQDARIATSAANERDALAALAKIPPNVTTGTAGRVLSATWIPWAIRSGYLSVIRERWLSGADHSAFRQVSDDAMDRMFQSFDLTDHRNALVEAAVSPVISYSLRAKLIGKIEQAGGSQALEAQVAAAAKRPDARVASELFAYCPTSPAKLHALVALFRSQAPLDDDEGTTIVRRFTAALTKLGIGAFPLVFDAASIAVASDRERRLLQTWLTRLDTPNTVQLWELLEGVATVRNLRSNPVPRSPLAVPWQDVQRGLIGWIANESTQVDKIEDLVPMSNAPSDANWAARSRHAVDLAERRLDYLWLAKQIRVFIDDTSHLAIRLAELTAQANDVVHAESLLHRRAADLVRDDREELLRSARAQIADERANERVRVARLVGETVTAIQRVANLSQEPALGDLLARVHELAADLGLTVTGEVGARVIIDPSVHEAKGTAGHAGEVRRVGVVDRDGSILLRPVVSPVRGSTHGR